MKINKDSNFNNLISFNKEDITIKDILKFFLRNKLFISSLSLVFFIFYFIYTLSLKNTWEGQFQIVLDSKKVNNNFKINNPIIENLINPKNNNLKTQVGILESPSLLMPIFNFVVSQEDKNFLKYQSWVNSLTIKLKKGTSILDISYKDEDKELILPVLQKLSIAYQEYSGRNERINQSQLKDYLNNQIKIYTDKSTKSMKLAQEFAIEKDLIYLESNNFNIGSNNFLSLGRNNLNIEPKNPAFMGSTIGIENIRVKASNQIKKIDLQIEKIKELGDDFGKVQFIGSIMPDFEEEGKKLLAIEEELIMARSKYTDKDPTIKNIKVRKESFIKLLKERAIGILDLKREEALSTMKAATRPKDVLVKYKEYLREAYRDEQTLIGLEEQFRFLELEQAKTQTPWELITKPTLLNNPVAPKRNQLYFLGLLFSILLGTLFSFYREKKAGKIFDEMVFENLFKTSVIGSINLKGDYRNAENFVFLREFFKCNSNKKICLLFTPEINNEVFNQIKDIISDKSVLNISKNFEYINNYDDLDKFVNADERIVVSYLGRAELIKLENLSKNLKIYNLIISGLILVNDSN